MAFARQSSLFGMVAAALAILAPSVGSADAQSRVVAMVTDFHGKYGLVVRDARGRVIDVALHPGTIIKPEGLRLERGMIVMIVGQAADRAFAASEIDTPYQLPPSRSVGSRFTAYSRDTGLAPQPAGDPSRFNNLPGDIDAPRMPEVPR